ncbi:LuxR C-terminal-related transcriptional regulator [Nakamurella sp. GG22]
MPAQRPAHTQIPRRERPNVVTVLLVDPARESRELLSGGLIDAGIGRVIVAESVGAAEDIVDSSSGGDLALISLALGESAVRLIRRLRSEPWRRVVALAPSGDVPTVLGALQAGASGVLRGHPKTPVAELPRLVHELTDREIEVLTDVADGRSNKWIGEHLSLSALTVKSHLARISRKLGTGDRAQMVAIAMRAGLIA